MKKTLLIGLLVMGVVFTASVVMAGTTVTTSTGAHELGSTSGSWEPIGHWKEAGSIGIVGERRPLKKKTDKVKVFLLGKDNTGKEMYYEFEGLREYPKNVDLVTRDELVKWFGHLGEIVKDESFTPEDGEKATRWRYFIE